MKPLLPAALAATIILSACADKSAEIAPAYVSPNNFAPLDCAQLRGEAAAVSARANQAMAAQDRKADNDAAATAIGAILFWPALFMIKGDGASAAEVARLKGEMQAIEAVNRSRNCGISFAS